MVNIPLSPELLAIPPLENGDRLTRQEFERRYQAMPKTTKAERIEGVVYVATALRFRSHGLPHANIMGWLWTYKVATPGVELGDTPTVRLDLDNDPQPDAVLLIEPALGGQARISDDDYIEAAPEFVAEIAASSATIDLGAKKQAYRRNGVQEYLVWQVYDRRIDWFSLQEDDYVPLATDADRVIRSQVFPGLWLAVDDLLAGNITQVLAALQTGLSSAEHQAFLQRLG
jgi:Uma2 family endonuclease